MDTKFLTNQSPKKQLHQLIEENIFQPTIKACLLKSSKSEKSMLLQLYVKLFLSSKMMNRFSIKSTNRLDCSCRL